MNSFFEKVAALNKVCETQLCIGLDKPSQEIEILRESAGKASTVKIQSAFYETDPKLLYTLTSKAHYYDYKVILDYKRCDIGSTMEAYISNAFEHFEVDAITIVPYMGLGVLELLKPWIDKGKGVYIVWLSSNPDGAVLQEPILEKILELSSGYEVGYVLGATKVDGFPLLNLVSDKPLLLPGFGAQNAEISDMNMEILKKQSANLFPVSRGLQRDGFNFWRDKFKLEQKSGSD
jgi:orotidine 5'-phosphate decarboxylase subfamily 2